MFFLFISFPLAIQFTKDVDGRLLLRNLVPSDNLQTLLAGNEVFISFETHYIEYTLNTYSPIGAVSKQLDIAKNDKLKDLSHSMLCR